MNPFTNRRLRGRVASGVAMASVLILGVWATTAQAHGGTAELTVEAHPEEGAVSYHVQATWEDSDPVEDGSVTAVATSPSGEVQTPVTMQHTEGGMYEASVTTAEPGTWDVVFTLQHGDLTEPATATEQAEGSEAAAAPEEEAAPAPEPADEGAEVEATDAAAEEEDDGGGSMVLIIAVLVVVGVILAAVFWAVAGRKSKDEDEDEAVPTR